MLQRLLTLPAPHHIAAEAARVAYNVPKSVREERVAFYLDEAARYEAIAGQQEGDIS